MAREKTSDALTIVDRDFFSTSQARVDLEQARESAENARRSFIVGPETGIAIYTHRGGGREIPEPRKGRVPLA